MLTIGKPTLFTPDGLAAKGQCSLDSPGWQLRWFDGRLPPILVWQGAFKTCRHLQSSCVSAASLEEVKAMVEQLLNAASFTHFASQPTDLYPAARDGRPDAPHSGPPRRKRRKKKR